MSSDISKLLRKNRYEEAFKKAIEGVFDDVRNRRLHRNLVIQWRVPRKYKKFMPKEMEYQDESLERFVSKNKDNELLAKALTHYKLGLIYENLSKGWFGIKTDQLEKALDEYDKALSLFPDFACALFRKGAIYSILRKFDKALESFIKAGEADPLFCEAFFFQGNIYTIMGDLDRALESYKRAVEIDKDNAAAHNNMGLIYYYRREYKLAEKAFREVLRIFPNHPVIMKYVMDIKSRLESKS
ncbi:hypothetical protein DRN86_03210 [Candidatus Geothermarchaeota archaeon]|nr:MAG: hypothetical protein DRN86_03210 [Candidatus Geothermarchaeota archaeon]